jgi:hypothetical protein
MCRTDSVLKLSPQMLKEKNRMSLQDFHAILAAREYFGKEIET